MDFRVIAARIIFTIHLIVFLAFPLGFFIPSSAWSERIEYHFLYCSITFLLFYIWGLIWTLKFKDKCYGICFLDTLMQRLRGYRIYDPGNYQHSFVEELSERLGLIRVPKKSVPMLLLICIIASAALYTLKLKGIILY